MDLTKQLRCVSTMWILSVLSFTYRVIIDKYNNSTGPGRSKMYGMNGSDKSYLRQKFA